MRRIKKMVAACSLLLLLILCNAFAPPLKTRVVKGDKIYFNGNVITYTPEHPEASIPDTVIDNATGQMRITNRLSNLYATKVNKETIAMEPDEYPGLKNGSKDIDSYIFNELKPILNQLDTGRYFLFVEYLVIDSKGRVCYFEFEEIQPANFCPPTSWVKQSPIMRKSMEFHDYYNPNFTPWGKTTNSVSEVIQKRLRSQLEDLMLKQLQLVPAKMDGVPVACQDEVAIRFQVKDHVAIRR